MPHSLGNDERSSTGPGGRSPIGAAMRLGGAIRVAALRPAAGALSAGRRMERRARGAVGELIGDAALSVLDAALASRVAEEAVDKAMASGLTELAIDRALEGPLVDALAGDLVRYAVVERIADRLLADGIVEHTVDRVLDGPELERVVRAVLESPAVERLLAQAIDSRLVDEAVARLLDSEDLWLLVEEIVQSPAVTAAITQQGAGFADQVAGGVRARSRNADARLERAARRALRRPPRGRLPAEDSSKAAAP